MRYVNPFYIAIVIVGISLFILLRPENNAELSFYGFAESSETEINYNYPVVVDKIGVQAGQAVKEGDVLMHISRRKSKDLLVDQQFKIAELRADEALWRQRKENEIAILEQEKRSKLSEIRTEINGVRRELDFKKSLTDNLKTVTPSSATYKPLEDKLLELEEEEISVKATLQVMIDGLKKEISLGDNPIQEQIKRLIAEQEFDEAHQVQNIIVAAPSDGLIGNISCKEEEHIPSYRTLLSFYEPHSGIIKGYVHEDLTTQVRLGDQFEITSLKDETVVYDGVVVGLGSRIVEIPARLRKIPAFKSFGREVLLEIPLDNIFLQKEKVGINFIADEDQ